MIEMPTSRAYKYRIYPTIAQSKEDLEKLLWEKPTSQLAKELGVSDKGIEKWAKAYGISKPPRGYWQKKKHGHID